MQDFVPQRLPQTQKEAGPKARLFLVSLFFCFALRAVILRGRR